MILSFTMFLLLSISKLSFSRARTKSLQMSSSGAAVSTAFKHTQNIPYSIRTAKREDITRMDRCNRANLPENYGLMFYKEHLDRWPELSLIALSETDEMLGYALGRVEMAPIDRGSNLLYSKTEYVAHIASIAVNEQFRGRGVARNLMLQLQTGFAQHYDIDTVTLYCRVSNAAAIKLYSDSLNYVCQRTVPGYYADGEDACLMQLTGLVEGYKHTCNLIQQEQQARRQQESSSMAAVQVAAAAVVAAEKVDECYL